MTDKQPDALQYADRDHIALGDYYLRHVSAMTGEALHAKSAIAAELAHRDREIDRLHAELETLRAKLKTHEDLGDAADDVQLLRMGYAAARLEIESLKEQLAGRASHGQASAPLILNCKSEQKRLATLWGFVPAQPAPATVAGCTRSHPHENMDSACRAKTAIAEMRNKAARGAEATAHDLDRFVVMLTAAPTTQPAPQADSVLEDAARYRWLRRWKGQEHEPPFTVQHEVDGTLWGGDLDAAIDAAMDKGANHDNT